MALYLKLLLILGLALYDVDASPVPIVNSALWASRSKEFVEILFDPEKFFNLVHGLDAGVGQLARSSIGLRTSMLGHGEGLVATAFSNVDDAEPMLAAIRSYAGELKATGIDPKLKAKRLSIHENAFYSRFYDAVSRDAQFDAQYEPLRDALYRHMTSTLLYTPTHTNIDLGGRRKRIEEWVQKLREAQRTRVHQDETNLSQKRFDTQELWKPYQYLTKEQVEDALASAERKIHSQASSVRYSTPATLQLAPAHVHQRLELQSALRLS